MIDDLTDHGRELLEGLRAIYLDAASTNAERLKAYELMLAYHVGRPETQASLDVTARALVVGPPPNWSLMGPGEKAAVLDALQSGQPLALPPAPDDEEED